MLDLPRRDFGELVLGEKLPRRGGRLLRGIGRFYLKLTGWKIEGDVPNVSKIVIIAAPHTSNWDFVVGMAVVLALGLRLYWLGKHTIFQGPLAPLMYWLGGIPINRQATQGAVKQVVTEFQNRSHFLLAIAPEGTRQRVPEWKTGFYYIAQAAQVPILPATINYHRKAIQIYPAFTPSGSLETDLPILKSYYSQEMGKKPNQF
ncbi:MAG: lysophospholipid acyltransferase family protein [Ardenticatenaceae bacterium]|nr:lysophospholipid acyltransferase family protein [Ardenticatenaceae bacterium]